MGEIQKLKNKKCLCHPWLHVFALVVLCPLCPLGPMFTMYEQVSQGGIDVHGASENDGFGSWTEHGDMGDEGTEWTGVLRCTVLEEEQVEWLLGVLECDPDPCVKWPFGVDGDLSEG